MVHVHPSLELTPAELCSTVDALRSAVSDRIGLAIHQDEFWQDNGFADAQNVFDTMVSAYSKGMMLVKETEGIAPAFVDHFLLSDEMWEVIDQISLANSPADLPVHDHKWESCVLCSKLVGIL